MELSLVDKADFLGIKLRHLSMSAVARQAYRKAVRFTTLAAGLEGLSISNQIYSVAPHWLENTTTAAGAICLGIGVLATKAGNYSFGDARRLRGAVTETCTERGIVAPGWAVHNYHAPKSELTEADWLPSAATPQT
jgi:hypothetical protein